MDEDAKGRMEKILLPVMRKQWQPLTEALLYRHGVLQGKFIVCSYLTFSQKRL